MRWLPLVFVSALAGCTLTITRAPAPTIAPRPAKPIVIGPAQPTERTPVPTETAAVDPEAATTLARNANAAAVPLADRDPPKLTAIALASTARSEARGMQAEGGVRHATLEEGHRATQTVALSPGDCVTVVAHGGLGVMEVDAFLLAPADPNTGPRDPASRPPILAEDTKNGPIAIIGGQNGCYTFNGSTPIQAELVVQARRGSGPVVAQVFRAQPLLAAPTPK